MRTFAFLVIVAAPVLAQTVETIQYLDSSFKPTAINNSNIVVGSVGTSAFRLVVASGAITQFNFPGSVSTEAGGINNYDQIVGSYSDGAHSHCFLRQSSGALTAFDAPGATDTWCTAINDSGQIAGYYKDALGNFHGLLKDGSTTTTIDHPSADSWGTKLTGINNQGEIVGTFSVFFAFWRGTDGTYKRLYPHGGYSVVGRINNLGQIATTYLYTDYFGNGQFRQGEIVTPDGTRKWTLKGSIGPDYSGTFALNDNGVILASLNAKPYVSVDCPITVSPSSTPVLSGSAQTVSFKVSAGLACGYVIRSQVDWIDLIRDSYQGDPVYGPGNATVSLQVYSNPNPGARTGAVRIGNQTVTLTQNSAQVCPPIVRDPSLQLNGAQPSTPVSTRVFATNGCQWSAISDTDWLKITAGASGGGTSDIVVAGAPIHSNSVTSRTGHILIGSQTISVTQSIPSDCRADFSRNLLYVDPSGGTGAVDVSLPADCNWQLTAPSWITINSPQTGSGSATIQFSATANSGQVSRSGDIDTGTGRMTVQQRAPGNAQGFRFVPATPCRIADTRVGSGFAGAFGAPSIPANGKRTIPVPLSSCAIPGDAKAFSLNITAVPHGPLSYITAWPTGSAQPFTSVLNSPAGTIVASAAIVQAGTQGSVDFFSTDTTDLVLDINGYFVSANSPQALAFYNVTPCRIADTRPDSGFTGPFGAPVFPPGGSTRTFPMTSSRCGIPTDAKAYVLNVTAVPTGSLPYITVWPTGRLQPVVSTLNSLEGRVVANAAIVPAGDNGDISVYALLGSNATAGVVLDITGYFGPPNGPSPQSFYPIVPCRLGDTREQNQLQYRPLTSPSFPGGSATRLISSESSPCALPDGVFEVSAYAMNVTAVPRNGALGYLTLWAYGSPQPFTSTLNSMDGQIVSNAAIVPVGPDYTRKLLAYTLTDAGKGVDLIMDLWGYFAP